MTEFKVGDVVKVKKSTIIPQRRGQTGKVIQVWPGNDTAKVQFPTRTNEGFYAATFYFQNLKKVPPQAPKKTTKSGRIESDVDAAIQSILGTPQSEDDVVAAIVNLVLAYQGIGDPHDAVRQVVRDYVKSLGKP